MIERYHIKGWNNDQIETKASDGEWVRYADHVSALTASASEPAFNAAVAAEEMLKTARELRENANGDCGAIRQAIHWEQKAATLAPVPASEPEPVAIAHIDHGKTSLTAALARGAVPVPTPDGAVEALSRAKQTLERYHRAGLGDEVFHADLTDTLRIVSAALSHPADGWRKIDSAPKDGSELLVWDEHSHIISQAVWKERHGHFANAGWYDAPYTGDSRRLARPTHWRSLPAVPVAKPEGE